MSAGLARLYVSIAAGGSRIYWCRRTLHVGLRPCGLHFTPMAEFSARDVKSRVALPTPDLSPHEAERLRRHIKSEGHVDVR